MESHERHRIESLAGQDSELRQVWEQHIGLKARLQTMNGQAHLTPEERVEKIKLQKLKLAAKDQIARILARHE